MAIASINPATGETLRTFPALDDAQIERALQFAMTAFATHRKTPFSERREKMHRAADILESEAETFARVMALEMGKPIRAGREEVRKCAVGCRYYADNAERFLIDEPIETEAIRSFVRIQPLGPVLAIMPWNFPFWQVVRFAAPALMAGNVGLLKHASNVPQCALALEDIFRRAGFREGVFQTLLIGSEKVESVLSDARVVAVTLTGSETAGLRVASVAGRLIKKTVLELGGSDPFIVMPSANVALAAATAAKARTVNSGQSCIAAKRFIIHEAIHDEFASLFVQAMSSLRMGDPLAEETDIGPLATTEILSDLEEQIRQTVAAGARVLLGGTRDPRRGNFYPPTILADVPENSPGYREELFGPVALLFRAADLESALTLANDVRFGLGASAWTNDETEAAIFMEELEAGLVFINAMVASDPRLPFGGIKQSGYGRELGPLGIREFVNFKTVSVGRAFHP
ncbi:MAG: succinate-semialdehyde dehydrogenase / glutarate-semialdehyde dehydrogenase [Chthoniobacter sp.]|jgi:succinate-semialdehyde dehydrogenase/glutarate-semialdehyde dehydrogenase|nr:succinate-semialdehyde dehydrogenase / glutarate-semialdehyde dehydrogenase [Chthoniobacter sp.]